MEGTGNTRDDAMSIDAEASREARSDSQASRMLADKAAPDDANPHLSSYWRFRKGLEFLLTNILQEMLLELHQSKLLGFVPKVVLEGTSQWDPLRYDRDTQNKALLCGQSLLETVTTNLRLVDSGPTYTWTLGKIPWMSQEGLFVHRGRERLMTARLRRSPGLFYWEETKGNTIIRIGEWRPESGVFVRVVREGRTGPLQVMLATRQKQKVPLEQLLRVLGFDEEEQAAIDGGHGDGPAGLDPQGDRTIAQGVGLGKEARSILSEEDRDRLYRQVQKRIFDSKPGAIGQEQLRHKGIELTSQATLRKEGVMAVLRSCVGFVRSKGIPPDDPCDLANLRVWLVGDCLQEALLLWASKVREDIANAYIADGSQPIWETKIRQILEKRGGTFTNYVQRSLFDSPSCRYIYPDRQNLVELAALARQVKLDFPAPSELKYEVRDFHWSHYGRLCPLTTSQQQDVGLVTSLALGARVNPLGQIETHCHPVIRKDTAVEIGNSDDWVSPWRERCDDGGWIAYPDQGQALLDGNPVWAHKGRETARIVDAEQVGWIHSSEEGLYGPAAALLPYRLHNDPVRLTMAGGFTRQALRLKEMQAPAAASGFERELAARWQYRRRPFPGAEDSRREEGNALPGTNLLVAYMPWYGWNFEDAIAISRSAAQCLTSIHRTLLEPIRIGRPLAAQRALFRALAPQAEALHREGIDITRYDEYGILHEGEGVVQGTVLAIEPMPSSSSTKGERGYWPMKGRKQLSGRVQKTIVRDDGTLPSVRIEIEGTSEPVSIRLECPLDVQRDRFQRDRNRIQGAGIERYDDCGVIREGQQVDANTPLVFRMKTAASGAAGPLLYRDPKRRTGRVIEIEREEGGDGYTYVRLTLEKECEAQRGDKIANRHGHKGVISQVFEDHRMPYFLLSSADGESTCACQEKRPHRHLQVLIHPASVIARLNPGQLMETLEARDASFEGLESKVETFAPNADGDATKLPGRILAGRCFFMKLDQNAAGKLHGRSHRVYGWDPVTLQPVGGKGAEGGQRLGEMEVWALQAHNATAILQEAMTIKSDNPDTRLELIGALHQKTSLSDPVPGEAPRPTMRSKVLAALGTTPGFPKPQLPEALRALAAIHYGLGMELIAGNGEQKAYPCFSAQLLPDEVQWLGLRLLDQRLPSEKGTSDTRMLDGIIMRKLDSPEDLHSEQIFGKADEAPLKKRRRLGFIELARPVPNPYILLNMGSLLWDTEDILPLLRSLLVGRIGFGSTSQLREFLSASIAASGQFQERVEARIALDLEDRGALEALQGLMQGTAEGVHITDDMLQDIGRLFTSMLRDGDLQGVDLVAGILEQVPPKGALAAPQWSETPSWCLRVLPVIPAELRLEYLNRRTGKTTASDYDLLYREVLTANKALEIAVQDREAVDKDKRQEYGKRRRDLQDAVARLMCNELLSPWRRRSHPSTKELLCSLSGRLSGKRGLLVANLQGKRVEFSGRAVIVPDPRLGIDECKLSLPLAIQLFEQQLRCMPDVDERALRQMLHEAKRGEHRVGGDSEKFQTIRWRIEQLLTEYPVLLNRQPTLHRLGMLAFRASLDETEGYVISIPCLVTAGYNADFDGDQMAIHVPLSKAAQDETERLYPSRHIWHPGNGRFALSLAEDLALGGYLQKGIHKKEIAGLFEASAADPKLLQKIEAFRQDAFKTATNAGVSFSLDDLDAVSADFDRRWGHRSREEDATAILSQVLAGLSLDHPLRRIVRSGARDNLEAMNYLAGQLPDSPREHANLTHGLNIAEHFQQAFLGRRKLVDTKLGTARSGGLTKDLVALAQHLWISESDCRASEGIPVAAEESTIDNPYGSWDEGKFEALQFTEEQLFLRLYGRILAKRTGDLEVGALLDAPRARRLARELVSGLGQVSVHSPLSCLAENGVCQKCYGMPWTQGRAVSCTAEDPLGASRLAPSGTRVGLLAAQAAGEPSTQMALRSKHQAGGVGKTDVGRIQRFFLRAYRSDGDDKPRDQVSTMIAWRNGVDSLYQKAGIQLASVHFETLLRGARMSRGWIAKALHPMAYENPHTVLAQTAVTGDRDPLRGLKERVLIGCSLPQSEPKPDLGK